MPDTMDTLAQNSKCTIAQGYYKQKNNHPVEIRGCSLTENILACKGNPVIAEVKLASPSQGTIKENVDVTDVASAMIRGGAVGLSVLTEPKYFKGSLDNLGRIRERIKAPLLMKDFIISTSQIDAASRFGADAILLIQALFDRNYCELTQKDMIRYAHSRGLQVLLEAYGEEEFRKVTCSDADMVGINNRDLRTFTVDLNNTALILKKNNVKDRIVVSESGIESPHNLRFLREAGAQAFLIGTSVMSSGNIEEKVRELTEA